MNITQIPEGFALYKEKDEIGRCALTPTPKGGTFGAFCILPQWRRKGYGSYLLKEALRALGGYDREQATVFTAPLPTDPGEAAFWAKFDFQPEGAQLVRRRAPDLTAVRFVQDFLAARLTAPRPGGVLSAILYSGRVIGSDEKQHILQWARALPLTKCTVLVCDFANWADTAPLPCLLLKK